MRVRVRLRPQSAYDPGAGWWNDTHVTTDEGTFYRILGVDDPEWPTVNMSTTGPACVTLGGSTRLCGSGSGSVLAVQPEAAGGAAQGAIDIGALLSRVSSLERALESAHDSRAHTVMRLRSASELRLGGPGSRPDKIQRALQVLVSRHVVEAARGRKRNKIPHRAKVTPL